MDKQDKKILEKLEPTYKGKFVNMAHHFISMFPLPYNDLKKPEVGEHINKVKHFIERLDATGLIELDGDAYKELGELNQFTKEHRWFNDRPMSVKISEKGYSLLKEERERHKDIRRFRTTLTISITTAIIAICSCGISYFTYHWNTTKNPESLQQELQSLSLQVRSITTHLQSLTTYLQSDTSVKRIKIEK